MLLPPLSPVRIAIMVAVTTLTVLTFSLSCATGVSEKRTVRYLDDHPNQVDSVDKDGWRHGMFSACRTHV
jgi:hypothetical protein